MPVFLYRNVIDSKIFTQKDKNPPYGGFIIYATSFSRLVLAVESISLIRLSWLTSLAPGS